LFKERQKNQLQVPFLLLLLSLLFPFDSLSFFPFLCTFTISPLLLFPSSFPSLFLLCLAKGSEERRSAAVSPSPIDDKEAERERRRKEREERRRKKEEEEKTKPSFDSVVQAALKKKNQDSPKESSTLPAPG